MNEHRPSRNEELQKERRSKNLVLLAILVGFVALMYLTFVIRAGGL